MESICKTKDWECLLIKQDKELYRKSCKKLAEFQRQFIKSANSKNYCHHDKEDLIIHR
jgi:hypothetical protein